ncbi:MAG: exodeoxyribonuclease VII large subunit [Flavobacteriales bacterium]|nr:exodeoxyribonuclease VII large subunit [Flavobacteriales bacterium]
MPEEHNARPIFSLLQVALSLQKTVAERYRRTYWVRAELLRLNFYRQSGHCYPDLVEKKEGRVVAQMRAHIWREHFQRINARFLQCLGQPLGDGIKILFEARIVFDPVHGMSLEILDIDPHFTLGDLAAEKEATLRRLKAEGLLEANKGLPLALLPGRLAIISVESSKGYADFCQIMESCSGRFALFYMLFPARLQGAHAVQDIALQLRRIRRVMHHFDAVAIIRGGGGEAGLSAFNQYELARAVATFPLPVLTGIGHATNHTVVEQVAFYNAITPTKLAEFIIEKYQKFDQSLSFARTVVIQKPLLFIQDERFRLNNEGRLLRSATRRITLQSQVVIKTLKKSLHTYAAQFLKNQNNGLAHLRHRTVITSLKKISRQRMALQSYYHMLPKDLRFFLRQQLHALEQLQKQLTKQLSLRFYNARQALDQLEKNVRLLSPEQVLRRGYSITLKGDRALTSADKARSGDRLVTLLYEGQIQSVVIQPEKNME